MTHIKTEDTIIYQVKDIMRVMNIGRDRAYSLMKSKGFPSTQLGKTFFVTKKNFDDWTDNFAGRNFKL